MAWRYGIVVGSFLLCGAASPALSQSATATGTGVGISSSRSNAAAQAIGGGNAQSTATGGRSHANANNALTVNGAATPANTSASITTVPNAYAPGLTAAGLETCLGSVSGGGSALGWGATFGTTVPDPGCAARLDARTLWSFGLKAAAIARLCLMSDVYRSMPDICQRYLPQGQPGYAVAAGEIPPPPAVYAGGPVEVVIRRTGEHRMCDDYDVARQRCRVWARNP
jgi:hypothetical protein